MATTARLALPYPVPDDTVDVPRDVLALAAKLDPSAAIFASGVIGARPVAGVAGRFYWATDTGTLSYDTGAAWIVIGPYSAGGSAPPIVSSLPLAPVDGQECYFQTAAMATANVSPWHLRYRAAITDAFKWEAIGPHALRSYYDGQHDNTTPTYSDVPNTAIAVPLGGYYTHQVVLYGFINTAGGLGIGNVKYGTTTESNVHEIVFSWTTPLTLAGQSWGPLLVPGGGVITGRWRMQTSGVARLYRFELAVIPSRVG